VPLGGNHGVLAGKRTMPKNKPFFVPLHDAAPAVYRLGELRPRWLDETGAAVEDEVFALAAAAMPEVDAAGLETLLSLSHALARRGRRLRLAEASAPLRDACAALGLNQFLESPASV